MITEALPIARRRCSTLTLDDQLHLSLERFAGLMPLQKGRQQLWRITTGLLVGRSDGVVVTLSPTRTGRGVSTSLTGIHPRSLNYLTPVSYTHLTLPTIYSV